MDLQAAMPRATSATSIAWGILLILLGLAALAAPVATSVSFTLVLAWVLMLVGITHLLSAWNAGTLLAVTRKIAVGLLYFAVGMLIHINPLWGVTSLTMVVGAVVLADGVIGLVTYFSEEDRATSSVLGAIVTLLLGSMIINQWPFSSLWTIGTLVGVNLLVAGMVQTFAIGARRLEPLGPK
jgi:uncharacterized membrane protein HdeD (DUF308 family)